MHPCPCCGYRTLPTRGDYELCPVCWWEDEGGEPWDYSGANGQTLVEAQQQYLALRRPYRLRPGKVRGPRQGEARAPDWRPFVLSEKLLRRVERAHLDWQRSVDGSEFRASEEEAGAEHNVRLRDLVHEAQDLHHSEIMARLRDLSGPPGQSFSDGQLELLARRLKDEHYYRRHPLRAGLWLVHHARPGTLRRRWAELRHGIGLAG